MSCHWYFLPLVALRTILLFTRAHRLGILEEPTLVQTREWEWSGLSFAGSSKEAQYRQLRSSPRTASLRNLGKIKSTR